MHGSLVWNTCVSVVRARYCHITYCTNKYGEFTQNVSALSNLTVLWFKLAAKISLFLSPHLFFVGLSEELCMLKIGHSHFQLDHSQFIIHIHHSSGLKMEAVCSSGTLVSTYTSIQHYNPGDYLWHPVTSEYWSDFILHCVQIQE
jgi:hypothetical protein